MSWKTVEIQTISTPLHLYNRGVNGERIFCDAHDYEYWMELLARALPRYPLDLHLNVLMPNHYHMDVVQQEAYAVSWLMMEIGARYVRYFNKRHRRYGHLFQGRFVPKIVQDNAGLLRLSHYIHMNPVAAKLCSSPESWPYSSCSAYLGDGQPSLVKTAPVLNLVGGVEAYREFLATYDPGDPLSVYRFLKDDRNMK
jgi:putative transposase